MLGYYGTRISTHITKTPEGYLVAHRVPINRTGWQEYTPKELNIKSDLDLIKVYRSPEEVFHPDALESFEGKDITDEHPHIAVDPSSWSAFSRGHLQNVHRGRETESSYDEDLTDRTLADLVIKDGDLISKVEPSDGKREISCGYNYELYCFDCKKPYRPETGIRCTCKNPTRFEQKFIRGNHVAVVESGRAGPTVRINDDRKEIEMAETQNQSNTVQVPTSFFDRLLDIVTTPKRRFASDDDKHKGKDDDNKDDKVVDDDDDARKARDARLDKMCDEWEEEKKKKKAKDKKSEDDDDMIDDDDKHEEDAAGDEDMMAADEPTEVTPEHGRPFNPIPGHDKALVNYLRTIKPVIAKSGDRAAKDSWNKAMRRAKGMPQTRSANDGENSYSHLTYPAKPEKKDKPKTSDEVAADYQESLKKLKGEGFNSLQ